MAAGTLESSYRTVYTCSSICKSSPHWECVQVAADNAVFGQTGPKVGSFDAGYGSTQMARLVGQKKAREIWFLARLYTAQQVHLLRHNALAATGLVLHQ